MLDGLKHTHRLLGGGIIIIELSTEEVKPFPQIENAVIHEVAGATFNEKDAFVGQILGQPAGNHAAGGPSADNEIVIGVDVTCGKMSGGSHCVFWLLVGKGIEMIFFFVLNEISGIGRLDILSRWGGKR